jgi:hypothetical protein
MDSLQKLCSSLEPILRRVVSQISVGLIFSLYVNSVDISLLTYLIHSISGPR